MGVRRLETWIAAGLLAAFTAQGETLYRLHGVAREGTLWTVTRGLVVCHILENRHPAEEYEWTKANDGQPLEVRLLEFARDEPFRSFEDGEQPNKKLNRETANRRAWSVRDAHREIAGQDSRIGIPESEDERVPVDHHPRWSGGPRRPPCHGASGTGAWKLRDRGH